MINLRHIKKFLGLIILGLLLSSQSFADKKFDKDLKKVSKNNAFINNKGEVYSIEEISDKQNTILVIYSHGSGPDHKMEKCLKSWNLPPLIITNLHNKEIKGYKVKIYRLCSGVRGWTENERDQMYDDHKKNKKLSVGLKDKEGSILINEQLQFVRQKIIEKKIDILKDQGFHKIVLAGHSAGAWASITLNSKFPEKIDGVIALNPAFAGKIKGRSSFWEDIRKYGIDLINLSNLKNVLIFSHNKDKYENSKTLSFLSKLDSVDFNDLSKSNCKAKRKFNKYHGLTLTKCFAASENNQKKIIKYLEGIL